MLNAVFCDSKGDLWVVGTGELDRYNRETDNLTHVDHNLPKTNPELNNNIYFIAEDRDHRVLVGTPFGLNSIMVTKGGIKVTYILHRTFEGLGKDIFSVSQTSQGDFWAGSDNGLVHVPANGNPPQVSGALAETQSEVSHQHSGRKRTDHFLSRRYSRL